MKNKTNTCSRYGCDREVPDDGPVANIDGLNHPLCQDHFEEFARWENAFFDCGGRMADEELEGWFKRLRHIQELNKTIAGRLEVVLSLVLRDPTFKLDESDGRRVSGSVISDTFAGLGDSDRQGMMRSLIGSSGIDKRKVGTLLAYTNEEWDVPLDGDPE